MLICAATLLLKVVIPTGYMIGVDDGRIAITLCAGTAAPTAMTDMPGMHGAMPDHGKPTDHGKAEMPCVFSVLSAAMLAAIDPLQLAALIAFILSTGVIAARPPVLARAPFLRPPLRGPPASL